MLKSRGVDVVLEQRMSGVSSSAARDDAAHQDLVAHPLGRNRRRGASSPAAAVRRASTASGSLVLAVRRAASDIGKIDEFYSAANTTKSRCYGWLNAAVDLCFVKRAANAMAGVFTVAHTSWFNTLRHAPRRAGQPTLRTAGATRCAVSFVEHPPGGGARARRSAYARDESHASLARTSRACTRRTLRRTLLPAQGGGAALERRAGHRRPTSAPPLPPLACVSVGGTCTARTTP